MSESSKEGRRSAKLDLDTYVSVSWCNDPARDITMEQFISLPKQQFDDVLYILRYFASSCITPTLDNNQKKI